MILNILAIIGCAGVVCFQNSNFCPVLMVILVSLLYTVLKSNQHYYDYHVWSFSALPWLNHSNRISFWSKKVCFVICTQDPLKMKNKGTIFAKNNRPLAPVIQFLWAYAGWTKCNQYARLWALFLERSSFLLKVVCSNLCRGRLRFWQHLVTVPSPYFVIWWVCPRRRYNVTFMKYGCPSISSKFSTRWHLHNSERFQMKEEWNNPCLDKHLLSFKVTWKEYQPTQMTFEQDQNLRRILIVPHPLWHRTPVSAVSSERPAHFEALYDKQG